MLFAFENDAQHHSQAHFEGGEKMTPFLPKSLLGMALHDYEIVAFPEVFPVDFTLASSWLICTTF